MLEHWMWSPRSGDILHSWYDIYFDTYFGFTANPDGTCACLYGSSTLARGRDHNTSSRCGCSVKFVSAFIGFDSYFLPYSAAADQRQAFKVIITTVEKHQLSVTTRLCTRLQTSQNLSTRKANFLNLKKPSGTHRCQPLKSVVYTRSELHTRRNT